MALQLVQLQTDRTVTQDEIVQGLESLLERARAGEFQGIAWTASLPDGSAKTGWTRSIDFHALLSGVATLQWRMISSRQTD
jgi:hypothetical protein